MSKMFSNRLALLSCRELLLFMRWQDKCWGTWVPVFVGCLVLLAVSHHHVCRERDCSRGITVGAVVLELLSGRQSTPEDLGTATWFI